MAQSISSTCPITGIPEYLKPYIVDQDASLYMPIDHAGWRFILKISRDFFAQYAHQKYQAGLRETGILTERIPRIEEMNACLSRFGWGAVAVSGFIPTAVFMEFLSLGILPIACDMRKLEHLDYTPAPDIVHEAAGHAPIVSDLEYAGYLRQYGELARRAIMSKEDIDIYLAVRNLSVVKEDPASDQVAIHAAEQRLEKAVAAMKHESEMTYLTRMGWWTFEYGLIGDLSNPKIYGAGLLSSVGESYHCLGPEVKKVPFSIDCIHVPYDITRPQPQLFVANDFQHLKDVLQELSNMMSFRRGGIEGLNKAIQARHTTTLVLDTGLQISGILTEYKKDQSGNPCFVKFLGPVQIATEDQQLEGHGPEYHHDGFSSPLGFSDLTQADLETRGFKPGRLGRLEFESGIILEGKFIGSRQRNGKSLLLSFQECTVKQGDEILYKPEWGNFDLACGSKVISVFGGAADRLRYLAATGGYHQPPRSQKTNLCSQNLELNQLYAKTREIRETRNWSPFAKVELEKIYQKLQSRYPEDWLLRFELYELSVYFGCDLSFEKFLLNDLNRISAASAEKKEMIRRGLDSLRTGNEATA